MNNEEIRKSVRAQYGAVAREGAATQGCGAPSCCTPDAAIDVDAISAKLGYSGEDLKGVPEGANLGLGCGNPAAIAALQPGETVLDLGSGGGFDCFLASQKVGPTGQVIGVDMTPDMVERARKNAAEGGFSNVDFRLGEIEALPVPDTSVDVIISNCVINLSPDKDAVFREAFRVLRPGGRLAISDVIAKGEIPKNVQEDVAMVAGCVGGAETADRLQEGLQAAGFADIRIAAKDGSAEFISEWVDGADASAYIISATIEARR